MTIEEIYSYVKGYAFTRDAAAPYRVELDLFDEACRKKAQSSTAERNLSASGNYKEFFKNEPDIAHFVPLRAWEEIYYCFKNGYAVPAVPARALYKIKLAHKQTRMPNLIFKCIPDKELQILFQKNYLDEGYTYVDVVCTFINQKYRPLSSKNKKVNYGSWSEVFVQQTDMVAALPDCVASKLGTSDISRIEVDGLGLNINGTYLRGIGGLYGAARSTYDLRECV